MQDFIFNTWKDVYLSRDKKDDPHLEFAIQLGVSREEAKQLCYRVMFQIPFLTKILVGLKPKQYRKQR